MDDEERRAALYRAQCARRAANRAAQLARLAGDPAAAARVRAAWAPLLPAPSDGYSCPCPPDAEPITFATPMWLELPEYMKRRG